jgi:hypothetical protein
MTTTSPAIQIPSGAPVHFMMIPKEHIITANDIRGEHGPVITECSRQSELQEEGIGESGYRLVFNVAMTPA